MVLLTCSLGELGLLLLSLVVEEVEAGAGGSKHEEASMAVLAALNPGILQLGAIGSTSKFWVQGIVDDELVDHWLQHR